MSQEAVERLLSDVVKLSDEDRLLFDRRPAVIDEAPWRVEEAQARKAAEAAGIDPAHIDWIIEKLRYG